MSKVNPHLNFWANILLLVGLIFLSAFGYLSYQRFNPQNLAFTVVEAKADNTNKSLQPIGLTINSINLSLGITPSEIKNNKWEASTTGVSYLKTSTIPGDKGNAVLYGHNWSNLLGNLKNTKPGDKLTVIYNDNSYKNFEIEYLTRVSPDDTSILKDSEDNRITLYTCTGFLDRERLVVVAKLLNS